MMFYRLHLDVKFLFLLFLCFFPIGVDGIGQLFGIWESDNIIRMITGLLAGFFCGVSFGVILDEIKEMGYQRFSLKK
jgi:uncharacterized membrane protein